ncbi:hypothetical protein EWM64_g9144 [Hericium alpestre]|uniref:Major facilitator superfamily (MFS) profile domain-containing protein n=1 Tax=Hericium alpestre TaxID=135208 RepID=A0A4Y9ZLA2_9AGAM|nr:hypothetical protein EWM64_g9144 [Hericium alpestre]
MGWRYLLFTLGGLMLLLSFVRLFVFKLYESPRFLIGRGRDTEAVTVVHAIARYNGVESTLSIEDLRMAEKSAEGKPSAARWRVLSEDSSWNAQHVRALFATRKMAFSSSLLIALWGIIGLASTLYNSFLPFLLASRGAKFADATYYTTYRNIMYGVLYAISPELFPAKDRGTGNGLVSTATRIFGVIAPVIALYANLQTAVPVYISGALIIGAGGLALLLPFEPRGRASI